MNSSRWLRWSILVLIFGVSGCSDKGASDERDATYIAVVGSQWYGHAPIWVGIEEGIFDNHGFNVGWKEELDSRDRVDAISSGTAKFASVGAIAMLQAMSRGNRGFYWVGSQNSAPGLEGIVVRSGIESLADLDGKTVGTRFGSSAEFTARVLLEEAGLFPIHKHIKLVDLGIDELGDALSRGDIDAASVWEPYLSRIKRGTTGAKILELDDSITPGFGAASRTIGPDVLLMNRQWVDERPEEARRFLLAYFEALNRLPRQGASHLDAAAKAVAASIIGRYTTGQEQDEVVAALKKIQWLSAEEQDQVMSDKDLYSHLDDVIERLYAMKAVWTSPLYQAWVRRDLWPVRDLSKTDE